jgi:hypothetical protein
LDVQQFYSNAITNGNVYYWTSTIRTKLNDSTYFYSYNNLDATFRSKILLTTVYGRSTPTASGYYPPVTDYLFLLSEEEARGTSQGICNLSLNAHPNVVAFPRLVERDLTWVSATATPVSGVNTSCYWGRSPYRYLPNYTMPYMTLESNGIYAADVFDHPAFGIRPSMRINPGTSAAPSSAASPSSVSGMDAAPNESAESVTPDAGGETVPLTPAEPAYVFPSVTAFRVSASGAGEQDFAAAAEDKTLALQKADTERVIILRGSIDGVDLPDPALTSWKSAGENASWGAQTGDSTEYIVTIPADATGKIIVTATAKDDPGKTRTVTVAVTEPPEAAGTAAPPSGETAVILAAGGLAAVSGVRKRRRRNKALP